MSNYTYPSNPVAPITKDEVISTLGVLLRITITVLWCLGLTVYTIGKWCGYYYHNHETVDAAFVAYTESVRAWATSNTSDLRDQVAYTVLFTAEVVSDALVTYATDQGVTLPPQVVTTHNAICTRSLSAFYRAQRHSTECFGLRAPLLHLRSALYNLTDQVEY